MLEQIDQEKKNVPDSLPIVLGSPIIESKSYFPGRHPIVESQELQWRFTSSCSFPYLRKTAPEKSKYTARSEINTYKTSYNRVTTLSFSLRVTNWLVVHEAFPFFLVRHLYIRASRQQHLSSAIFCSVRTDCESGKLKAVCASSSPAKSCRYFVNRGGSHFTAAVVILSLDLCLDKVSMAVYKRVVQFVNSFEIQMVENSRPRPCMLQ